MKKFFETIKNIFSVKELKDRIFLTLGLLMVFRLGSFIVLPGVDPSKLDQGKAGVLGFINEILGGAFERASIFALGIMPYISASIIIQLLTVAVPTFQKMQKEGESGRKKLTQITRALTILITIGQGFAYLKGTVPTEAIIIDQTFFLISSIIILTSGTVFCMWLGEKITDKGIGNGISLLIMIGIISRFPVAIVSEATLKGMGGVFIFVLEILALYLVVMGVVLIVQAVRYVPLQYVKQVAGRSQKQMLTQKKRSALPLKVNAAGVMPIIFAQALMFLPPLVAGAFQGEDTPNADYIARAFSNFTSLEYNILFAVLIIAFTFFYTAMTINVQQISDNLKDSGGFVPGVTPGEETKNYLGKILDRITFPGAIFIAIIAILPAIAAAAGVGNQFAQFYGGTSLLIMVGVVLDTLQQIESYLLNKEYDGLMNTGNVKGRQAQPMNYI
ncbi:protein translocase subunit secY/sec61 alpha [Bernardetia litoralis DSM 6794]|uniref:Protein translocase subunit SecY n=1 Tax=Bernardetia litoralis (strain ATCC 23117 / DSM 6794 / NBRC 15988 / NCIMB 1366 / Fx l1 / Sio-4) TaxID=880071 RepID=I4ALV7_BERLS|nr:preprotein translocase subunit SecY [Bernardetia litoralis]AFM04942.1 protein translocase subunit secY/sec61 alpha [Bernardetia litoralis DSM 6794]